ADFNGDGHLDLATANYSGGTVSVLLGIGNGAFKPAQSYAVGTALRAVAVGDFDGDDDLDLAAGGYACPYYCYEGKVVVLLGNGDSTFQTGQSYSGGHPGAVAAGDFDGDGDLDLAVANAYFKDKTVTVRLGNGDGTFQAAKDYTASLGPSAVVVEDFN